MFIVFYCNHWKWNSYKRDKHFSCICCASHIIWFSNFSVNMSKENSSRFVQGNPPNTGGAFWMGTESMIYWGCSAVNSRNGKLLCWTGPRNSHLLCKNWMPSISCLKILIVMSSEGLCLTTSTSRPPVIFSYIRYTYKKPILGLKSAYIGSFGNHDLWQRLRIFKSQGP